MAALGQLGFVAILMTLALGALITIFKAGGYMVDSCEGRSGASVLVCDGVLRMP